MPSKKKAYTFTYKGKRRYVRADSPKEAGILIEQKKRKIDESLPRPDMTLGQWYEMSFQTHVINQNEHSEEVFRFIIEKHLLYDLGTKRIIDIKAHELQRLLNSKKDFSKTTIDYIWSGIRFLFRDACRNEIIEKDPTQFLVKPKGKRTQRRALTQEEREAVLHVACTRRLYYGYLIMMLCGCRPGEAWECKGEDIFIKDGYPYLHIRGTKTKNADRNVPIPDFLYRLIKTTPKGEYISATDDGRKVERNYGRRWKHFTYHCNVYMGAKTYRNKLLEHPFGQDIVPYCLRHEYCTDLARKGIDIRIAKSLMGHSTIRMTADIYTNLEGKDIESAAKVLCGT